MYGDVFTVNMTTVSSSRLSQIVSFSALLYTLKHCTCGIYY